MNEIEWIKTKKTHRPDAADVRVKVNGSYTHITFYDGAYGKITNRYYVAVGMTDKRVYFKDCRDGCGFRLCSDTNDVRRKLVRLPGKREWLEGYYRLQHDSINKLWFIDMGARI